MNTLEFLYIVIAVVLIVYTLGFIVLVYKLLIAIEAIKQTFLSLYDASKLVGKLKDSLKLGVYGLVEEVLGRFRLGGEKHDNEE